MDRISFKSGFTLFNKKKENLQNTSNKINQNSLWVQSLEPIKYAKNCSENLDELKIPNNLVKDTSHNFFIKNKKKFNVIYIDGSHFYEDVKKDFINSMNCLEDDGILISDDFYWFFYEKIEQNPSGAIIECYENFKKNLDILFLNHQIIFKKKKELKN